jgi:hypothetical protein
MSMWVWVWGKEGKIFFLGKGRKQHGRNMERACSVCGSNCSDNHTTIPPFPPFANSTWTSGSKHTSASASASASASYQLPVPIPLPLPFRPLPCAASAPRKNRIVQIHCKIHFLSLPSSLCADLSSITCRRGNRIDCVTDAYSLVVFFAVNSIGYLFSFVWSFSPWPWAGSFFPSTAVHRRQGTGTTRVVGLACKCQPRPSKFNKESGRAQAHKLTRKMAGQLSNGASGP